jgi:opacity protein-like surface antigen
LKRMKRISIALLSVAAMALALPAAAQMSMSSVYVGGALGQSKFKDACNGIPGCDDKDTSWGLFAGYQLNRNFSAELGYHDLGSVSVPGASIDGNAWELVAVGAWPFTNQFSVYGKLGGYRGELKGGGVKESNTDITYGAGLQFDLNKNLGFRGEWQRYPKMGGGDFGQTTDVDVLRVSALWRFQ